MMIDPTTLTVSISLGAVIAILGLWLTIKQFKLNKQKKEAEDARAAAKVAKEERDQAVAEAKEKDDIRSDIRLLGSKVDNIGVELGKMAKNQDKMTDAQANFDKRLVALEVKCAIKPATSLKVQLKGGRK